MPAGTLMPHLGFPVMMGLRQLTGACSAQDKKMADQAAAAAHWDAAYAPGDDTRSWFENHPGMSLRMLGSAGVSAADAVIDVGGGASPLTGALLDRGFRDLTVLDISAAGMQHARGRLGSRADQVHWLTADVLSWHPRRHYQVWHDRAVYHFLTIDEHRQQYLDTLDTATVPDAIAVFGCFAPGRAAALLGPASGPLQPSAAGPPGRRQVATDQPGPGRACHPGRHHPAVHLGCAAKTVLSPGSPPSSSQAPSVERGASSTALSTGPCCACTPLAHQWLCPLR
jgi:hypothetical protein